VLPPVAIFEFRMHQNAVAPDPSGGPYSTAQNGQIPYLNF